MMLIPSVTPPVMIDIETGGLGPGAPIAAIGAVRFNLDGTPMEGEENEFYVSVSMLDQPPPDASTFYWWLKQSDEARAAICEGEHGMGLLSALWKLRHWISGPKAHREVMRLELDAPHQGEVWVRGDRDSVWLEEAHKRCKLPLPYKYGKVRDQRTMVQFGADRGVDIPWQETTAHNALLDARYQVECLQAVMKVYPPLGDY